MENQEDNFQQAQLRRSKKKMIKVNLTRSTKNQRMLGCRNRKVSVGNAQKMNIIEDIKVVNIKIWQYLANSLRKTSHRVPRRSSKS
jgi:hypothetical protein